MLGRERERRAKDEGVDTAPACLAPWRPRPGPRRGRWQGRMVMRRGWVHLTALEEGGRGCTETKMGDVTGTPPPFNLEGEGWQGYSPPPSRAILGFYKTRGSGRSEVGARAHLTPVKNGTFYIL